jgi:hypothetical protein
MFESPSILDLLAQNDSRIKTLGKLDLIDNGNNKKNG